MLFRLTHNDKPVNTDASRLHDRTLSVFASR